MATDFNSEVSTELTSETKLTIASGKVANFCYDSDAYDNDTVAGVEEYDYDEHQNIPLGDATTLNTDSNILNKGVRSQASSLTRMMLNHFFGRTSYNINKISDHLKNFLTLFKTFIKEGDNEWSPTVIYEAGDVVYFMTTLNYEPCKRTFVCILDCPSVNLPPVYTDGSLINTTYWKEISGKVASLTVGTTNSGSTNVATFNGSITVAGNITQSGTPYETHAEQIYTKKDNIITREDATGALPSGQYSGIKVNNYDGNGANGILAYRSDGTAVVGDETGDPAVENLQPLLTRAEENQLTNGAPLVWDATNKRAVGGSTSGVSVISTASTTINNIPLSNNDSIRIMFTADISDTNATGGVTPLEITYNSVDIPVKVVKGGVLSDILSVEVLTNIWKYLQAYTIMELIYQSDYDGQGNSAFIVSGNPVVLSSSDYIIYADHSMEGCPAVNASYVQYPETKSPEDIWFLATWKEMAYGGAFFRSNGGNASVFNNEKSVSSISGTVLTIPSHGVTQVGTVIYDFENNESRLVTAINDGNTLTVDLAFTSPNITTVLIGQGQGTAVNGLYQDAHSHSTAMLYRGYVTGSGDIAYGGGGNYAYPGTSGAQPAIRSNDTETRSTNFTYKIWVRIA